MVLSHLNKVTMPTAPRSVQENISMHMVLPTPQRTTSLPAIRLIRNDNKFDKSKQHPLVHKHVWIIHGVLKGYTGFVITHNYVTQKFSVGLNFSPAQVLFEGGQLTEINRDIQMRSPACAPTPLLDSSTDDPTWGISIAQVKDSSHATSIGECLI